MVKSQKDYSLFQEGAKRFDQAMIGVPDRVPVYAQMHEFVMKELDVNAKKFYTTPETLVTGTLEVCEKYGIDVAFLDYDVYNIEAEAIGQGIIYSDSGMPDVDRSRPLIRGRDDLKKIKTPDFDSDGRFPNVIEMCSIYKKLTGVDSGIEFTAPFSLAANVRGIERLLNDIYEDPDFVRSLFDRLTEELMVPWICHLKKTFPNAKGIAGNDATASLPIVTPTILENWVVPYILRLRELCGPEIYVPNWVGERYLKDPREMFDLKLTVCPGFLEGQDPDVEVLGPAVYKEYAEKHGVSLILGIGAGFLALGKPKEIAAEKHGVSLILGIGAGFLALGKPKEIAQRVKHYVEVGGKSGRFALYLCNLGATTPPENVRAVIEAIDRYGIYS
jgi:uroporphyrinogen-III decarboxylase